MKIISLEAENVKRIRAISITPTGNVVEITGKNGSGKSSCLDAIWWALDGSKHIQKMPIRKGEEKAHIRLDLGEIIVTRRFTAAGSTLVVEGANKARFPSPQRMLDDLLSHLTFDPLAFTRMDAKKQLETLKGLVKLEVDVAALEGMNQSDFDKRTDIGRQIRQIEGEVAGIRIPENTPDERIDLVALSVKADEAGQHNAELERRKSKREVAANRLLEKKRELQRATDEVRVLEDQIEAMRSSVLVAIQHCEELKANAAEMETQFAGAKALPDPIDTAPIRTQIAEAEGINRNVDTKLRRNAKLETLKGLREQQASLSTAIDKRVQEKRNAIASAKMPVEGLSFDDDTVLFDGVPFEQASSAQQLRVSVGLAMAANPKLKTLLIKDGSLLDSDSLKLLSEIVTAADYQCWIERATDGEAIGIVIESGEVRSVNKPSDGIV